jgi:hypothetical protein
MSRMRHFGQAAVLCLATSWIAAIGMLAQEARPFPAPSAPPIGGPQDWSDRQLIFTLNGSPQDAWQLREDPRFLHSLFRRYANAHRSQFRQLMPQSNDERQNEASSDDDDSAGASLSRENFDDEPGFQPFITPIDPIEVHFARLARNKNSKVDWSVSLGPTAGMAFGETPAVYTANYSSPSCTNDFAVYTMNATPTVGKQANLVGLTNLYSTGAGNGFCSGTAPTFLFSYAIGTGGSPLSPVLSLDGTRVAWIENRGGTDAYLHVTVWVANQGGSATSPVAPTGTFPTTSGTCTPAGSSCDFALDYTNATYTGCTTKHIAVNGHSELYVDYPSNTGFISANNGLLYHIINIFSKTTPPSIDFCVPVNTSFETTNRPAMSGPIYDPLLNEVFITDSEKIYAYIVNATATTPNFAAASPASYTYASSYTNPTGPGPLIDMFNKYIYLFSTNDLINKTSLTQVNTSLGSPAVVNLGPETTNTDAILFYGAFDNNYYNNGPKSATSTLYSCGTDSTTTTAQDLFAISFNPSTGAVNTTPAMSYNRNINQLNATSNPENGVCSPLTEFYDGANDRLFVGMGQPGTTSGANFVTMWNINTQLTNTSGSGGGEPTYTAIAKGYLGGTSGIAADNNDSTTAQAESIYFSTEDAGSASTAVPNTTAYNVNGIYTDGSTFPCTGGLDDDGNAYSSTALGGSVTWNGSTFTFGPANSPDAWQATTVTLPSGQYSTLTFVGNAVNGNLASQPFVVNYMDGTNTTFTQSVSDWFTPQYYPGESVAATTTYRNTCGGTKDDRTFLLYGYSFAINPNKTVQSITLPPVQGGGEAPDNVVVVLGMALSTNCGGANYCAVKLTQSGLQ